MTLPQLQRSWFRFGVVLAAMALGLGAQSVALGFDPLSATFAVAVLGLASVVLISARQSADGRRASTHGPAT